MHTAVPFSTVLELPVCVIQSNHPSNSINVKCMGTFLVFCTVVLWWKILGIQSSPMFQVIPIYSNAWKHWNYLEPLIGLCTLSILILWKLRLQCALYIKKENSKLPSLFFHLFLFLIFYCFLIQFYTIINMFYDIFVMGMKSLSYINIKDFYVVLS